MTDDVLLVERQDRVLVLTLNRPDARNAISLALAERIASAIDEFDSDDRLRVGVITGAGATFSAGMDLKGFARGESPFVEGRGFAGLVERPPVKPLIAAVEGYALAGGFEIVLACDLVVAAEDATFGLPEVRRGLTAAGGGLFRLPRRVPYHLAMELILTGRTWPATDAVAVRLVNRLVEPGTALVRAVDLALDIASNAPLAIAASKQVIIESAAWDPDEAFDRQHDYVDPVRRSDDAEEGARAFVEKREPIWQGR